MEFTSLLLVSSYFDVKNKTQNINDSTAKRYFHRRARRERRDFLQIRQRKYQIYADFALFSLPALGRRHTCALRVLGGEGFLQ
jgi:hypothetical protein